MFTEGVSHPLWNGPIPGALDTGNGHEPALLPFLPESGRATGACMLVLPGGGYGHLADHEGPGYARWFAARGVAAFVLNYRLGSAGYRHPVMLNDAARALRTLRAHVAANGLDPARIGVIGSSAGGHLAATLLTQWTAGDASATDPIDRLSSRPDLGVLCYPVITMDRKFTHAGSRANLLGADVTDDKALLLSAERNVRPDTPPCFIWHTVTDGAVPVENALLFATALRQAGVSFDLHLYAEGNHGLGLCERPGNPKIPWTTDLAYWLNTRGFC